MKKSGWSGYARTRKSYKPQRIYYLGKEGTNRDLYTIEIWFLDQQSNWMRGLLNRDHARNNNGVVIGSDNNQYIISRTDWYLPEESKLKILIRQI